MDDTKVLTIEGVRQFLAGSDEVEFKAVSGEEKYSWVESVLRRFKYPMLCRLDKRLVRQYLEKVSGYSRTQMFRLIAHKRRIRWISRNMFNSCKWLMPVL